MNATKKKSIRNAATYVGGGLAALLYFVLGGRPPHVAIAMKETAFVTFAGCIIGSFLAWIALAFVKTDADPNEASRIGAEPERSGKSNDG